MMDFGLTPDQLEELKRILRPYSHKFSKVCVFGSRATGAFKPNSDIDLVLYGPVTQVEIDALWTAFNESNVPYPVDVVGYALLHHNALKAHIDRVAMVLFPQQDFLDV